MRCELKTFNVGDKVRILDVDAIAGGSTYWRNGDITEVVGSKATGVTMLAVTSPKYPGLSDKFPVFRGEFHAIERISPLSKKRRIEALEKDVARQETELEELRAKIEAFEQKAKSAVWLSDAMRKVTPNQRRARIIADAKDFVEQAIEDARDEDGDIYVEPCSCSRIDFVVDDKKRAVVALAIGYANGAVVKRAIAKCAPDDVFNADIGKAIATGRLFNLDVERFINAPKPDKKAVGQLIEIEGNFRPYVDKVISGDSGYIHDVAHPKSPIAILDDTEAQYE